MKRSEAKSAGSTLMNSACLCIKKKKKTSQLGSSQQTAGRVWFSMLRKMGLVLDIVRLTQIIAQVGF